MTARTIALSALMVELCSTCPLLAAAPVALSLTNAADYIATVPVNSNLIQGVGMGAGGAYRVTRAEDIEFLHTALQERIMLAAEPIPGLIYSWYNEPGRVPRASDDNYLWEAVRLRDFRTTYLAADTNATDFAVNSSTYFGSFGFVPPNWQPWTGYLKITGTNGWERNGYDAASDIRAVFDQTGSVGVPTNDIPTNLVFVGALSLAQITNTYAVLDSGVFDTILRGSEPVSTCLATNVTIRGWQGNAIDYDYTNYTVGDYSGRYASGGTPGPDQQYFSTNKTTVSARTMACHSERASYFLTIHGLQYSTEPTPDNPYPGGRLHVAAPIFETHNFDESLPDGGDLWRSMLAVVAGYTNVVASAGRICYTNMTVRAYLVCCWTCTTADRWQKNFNIPDMTNEIVTANHVTRLLSSHDLGAFECTGETRESRFYATPNVWRAVSSRVDDIQREALLAAEALACFEGRFFRRPPVEEFKILPSEYPATCSNGWFGCKAGTGFAIRTRRNEFAADKVYLLLLVRPTYHARVLGPASQ